MERVRVSLCPFVDFQLRQSFSPIPATIPLSSAQPSLASSLSLYALPTRVSTLHHGEWVW